MKQTALLAILPAWISVGLARSGGRSAVHARNTHDASRPPSPGLKRHRTINLAARKSRTLEHRHLSARCSARLRNFENFKAYPTARHRAHPHSRRRRNREDSRNIRFPGSTVRSTTAASTVLRSCGALLRQPVVSWRRRPLPFRLAPRRLSRPRRLGRLRQRAGRALQGPVKEVNLERADGCKKNTSRAAPDNNNPDGREHQTNTPRAIAGRYCAVPT
jgi:hypothetical protein